MVHCTFWHLGLCRAHPGHAVQPLLRAANALNSCCRQLADQQRPVDGGLLGGRSESCVLPTAVLVSHARSCSPGIVNLRASRGSLEVRPRVNLRMPVRSRPHIHMSILAPPLRRAGVGADWLKPAGKITRGQHVVQVTPWRDFVAGWWCIRCTLANVRRWTHMPPCLSFCVPEPSRCVCASARAVYMVCGCA